MVTGDAISAEEARRAGLVSRIIKGHNHDLDMAVQRYTAHICKLGRDSIALGKKTFYSQLNQPLNDAMESAAYAMVENMKYEDVHKGIAKFMSKKK